MSAPALGQIAALLAPAAQSIEQGFLAAGESLERAVAILDRLNARFAAQVAELTDGRLETASQGLAETGRQVTGLAEARAADGAALARLAGIVIAITRRVRILEPITREIDTLAMSARVVAADMGAAGGEFLSFTASIQAAVQRARLSLNRVREDLVRVDRHLHRARDDANSFTGRQSEMTRAIPQHLDANLHTVASRQKLAGDAATTAHRRAAAISRQVAEQIAALQLGDITRQRLEHVQGGIAFLDVWPAQGGLAGRILAGQLQDAADTLVAQGEQIERRLVQLAADAIAIDQLGLDIHAETPDRQDSFVTALRTSLRQTTDLFAELRTADGATERQIRSVLDATGDLAARLADIRSVEQDIHLIGLNATLKCGRLGAAGRPLAAVAQELRACGHRFASEAAGVLNELDRLRSQATGLLDPQRQQQHEALSQAADRMVAAVEQLHRLEGELQQGVTQLEADAERVGGLVAKALEQFSIRDSVAALMRQGAQQLEAWADTGAPGADDVLQRIAATYTMAREREVHARFAFLPEVAPAGSADKSDLDGFLF